MQGIEQPRRMAAVCSAFAASILALAMLMAPLLASFASQGRHARMRFTEPQRPPTGSGLINQARRVRFEVLAQYWDELTTQRDQADAEYIELLLSQPQPRLRSELRQTAAQLAVLQRAVEGRLNNVQAEAEAHDALRVAELQYFAAQLREFAATQQRTAVATRLAVANRVAASNACAAFRSSFMAAVSIDPAPLLLTVSNVAPGAPSIARASRLASF